MRRAGLLQGLVGAAAVARRLRGAGRVAASGRRADAGHSPRSHGGGCGRRDYENPQYPTIGRYPTNANIFETLVRMTPDYQLVPSLATSWIFVPPNTWRFQLRRDVKFQDGTPFTDKAVEFTIKQIGASGQGDYSA